MNRMLINHIKSKRFFTLRAPFAIDLLLQICKVVWSILHSLLYQFRYAYFYIYIKESTFEPNIFDTNLINNYRVFIKYCVFFRIYRNIPDSGLSLFSLGVSLCTHTSQVENQRWCRTDRVQKNHNILRKKHNI